MCTKWSGKLRSNTSLLVLSGGFKSLNPLYGQWGNSVLCLRASITNKLYWTIESNLDNEKELSYFLASGYRTESRKVLRIGLF